MEKINERLLSWASILEDDTREQALRTAAMPFIHPHVALMPDAHLGKGATVGSVIPTDGAIIPAAVGVDIGCGMMAVRTQFTAGDLAGRDLACCTSTSRARCPLSAGHANTKVRDTAAPRVEELRGAARAPSQADEVARTGRCSWARSVRATTSSRCRSTRPTGCGCSCTRARAGWATSSRSGTSGWRRSSAGAVHRLPDRDLAYLVEGEPEFDAYIEALRWAQRFAYLNREEMMDRVVDQVGRFLGRRSSGPRSSTATTTTPSGRRTSAARCGCRARGRSPRARASGG